MDYITRFRSSNGYILEHNMVLLCFVLDLRSLPPPILRDLKQSLFQLANYYAVSHVKIGSKPLPDRIGLCYVTRNRITCCNELKIAYKPHGNFSLRDLHHALSTLPSDAFSPGSTNDGGLSSDLKLEDLLGEKMLCTWGCHDKNASRKVILISCLFVTLDSVTMEALMVENFHLSNSLILDTTLAIRLSSQDAAEKRVSVEFILFEHKTSYQGNLAENIDHFEEQIGSLRNCSFQKCISDWQVLHALVKRWLYELKDEIQEPLQARFVFKTNLISSLNQISCNLYTSYNPIVDEFISCQTCRCHGVPLEHSYMNQTKQCSSCLITSDHLEALDIIENSVRVGQQTILHMPSFQDQPKLKQVCSPIEFNVIQRTDLGSLSEGASSEDKIKGKFIEFRWLVVGSAYYVSPSTYHNLVEDDKPELNCQSVDKSELNCQIFQVVCDFLNSLDHGLVCSCNCNIETAIGTSFRCYYILFPSQKGQMLLRRLSASEEFLPVPAISQLVNCVVGEEIERTVQASIKKIEVGDYNPIQHERGFHHKLNFLVKESLQFGAILPKSNEGISEANFEPQSTELQPSEQSANMFVTEDKPPDSDSLEFRKNCSPCIAAEWEQLLVTELGGKGSPKCTSISKLDQIGRSPSQSNKELEEKTSRILERLELPRELKRKAVSPTVSSGLSVYVYSPLKKPLIPYKPSGAPDQVLISSQPMKPSFQRIKRKK